MRAPTLRRLVSATLALAAAFALSSPSHARPDLSGPLGFESPEPTSDHPLGAWSGGPAGTVALDSSTSHSGRTAMRLQRDASSASNFSPLSMSLPVDFAGDSLELRGWLRFDHVEQWAGLWLREDATTGSVAFDNMQSRQLSGTRDWAEYRIRLPLSKKAKQIVFGALLVGPGTVRVDDLSLYVDGKPFAQVPVVERPKTVLDTDTTFAHGSGIDLTQPSKVQAENLALLGKVWGFLKYHHPAIVAGTRHWDFELFRVMPAVIRAPDHASACAEMVRWIDTLGPVPPCAPCVTLPEKPELAPPLAWLADRAMLGDTLSRRLRTIHERRPKTPSRFAIGAVSGVGNPDFSGELGYDSLREPDAGFRLLALFRFWNMVEYWFPDREMIGEDWDTVLATFVPRLAAAVTRDAYQTEMLALIARLNDTHANLWSSLDVRPPRGSFGVPVITRFVEGRAVVTGWSNPRLGPPSGLAIGDVIESLDDVPVAKWIERWRPYYAASNEPTRLREVALSLLHGDSSRVRLGVQRGGKRLRLEVARVPVDSLDRMAGRTHDHAGPTFRRLSDEIAYLRLGSLKKDSVSAFVEGASGAKLLVIDDRNYPSDFPLFELGGHLVEKPTPFVNITVADLDNPGAFTFTHANSLAPFPPRFGGAVAVLVDETTQSSAEYHALAFRSSPNAIVVGSTTAGADGNVSAIPLPGGLRTMFSGIGILWPDHRPTQRVGIVADVAATPTIAGVRAGRDEVFEAAVRKALGRAPTPAEFAVLTADDPKP